MEFSENEFFIPLEIERQGSGMYTIDSLFEDVFDMKRVDEFSTEGLEFKKRTT